MLSGFSELCQRNPQTGYAVHPKIVHSLTKRQFHKEYVKYLVDAIDDTLNAIETETESKVEYFKIGKSITRAKKSKQFSLHDPTSWCMTNVSSVWSNLHHKQNFSGLVILICITEDNIPTDAKMEVQGLNAEKYALTLERSTALVFQERGDKRCANTSSTGRMASKPISGSLVFLAYKLSSEANKIRPEYEEHPPIIHKQEPREDMKTVCWSYNENKPQASTLCEMQPMYNTPRINRPPSGDMCDLRAGHGKKKGDKIDPACNGWKLRVDMWKTSVSDENSGSSDDEKEDKDALKRNCPDHENERRLYPNLDQICGPQIVCKTHKEKQNYSREDSEWDVRRLAALKVERSDEEDDTELEQKTSDTERLSKESFFGRTTGLTDFEDLCKRHSYTGYVFHLDIISHMKRELCHFDNVDYMVKSVDDILSSIETVTKREVERFKIGKSIAYAKKGRTFTPDDPHSWSLSNISSRWSDYKRNNFNGLVVLACITEENIPMDIAKHMSEVNPENYAIKLEQDVIRVYIEGGNKRCLNDGSRRVGKRAGKSVDGGLVYIAYKLESFESVDEMHNDLKSELKSPVVCGKKSVSQPLRRNPKTANNIYAITYDVYGDEYKNTSDIDGGTYYKNATDGSDTNSTSSGEDLDFINDLLTTNQQHTMLKNYEIND